MERREDENPQERKEGAFPWILLDPPPRPGHNRWQVFGGRAQGSAAQMLEELRRISGPQTICLLHKSPSYFSRASGNPEATSGDSLCPAPFSLQGLNKTWVHQSASGSRKMRNCLFWAALRSGYAQWARLSGLRAELSGFFPCAFPPLPAQARFALYATPLSVSLWFPLLWPGLHLRIPRILDGDVSVPLPTPYFPLLATTRSLFSD